MEGHALWDSLPDELALRIQLVVRDRAYEADSDASNHLAFTRKCVQIVSQLNHAFYDVVMPVRYLLCPRHNPYHAKSFVKGVYLYATFQITNHAPLTTDFYSHLYSIVFHGCTRKGAENETERYYAALESQMKTLVRNGDINLTSPEERGWLLLFIGHVFKYLDRFYVKRLLLPKLDWSLEHWYKEALQPCLLGEPTPQFS